MCCFSSRTILHFFLEGKGAIFSGGLPKIPYPIHQLRFGIRNAQVEDFHIGVAVKVDGFTHTVIPREVTAVTDPTRRITMSNIFHTVARRCRAKISRTGRARSFPQGAVFEVLPVLALCEADNRIHSYEELGCRSAVVPPHELPIDKLASLRSVRFKQ